MLMKKWKVTSACKSSVIKWVRVTHIATGITASGPHEHNYRTVRRLMKEVKAKIDRAGVEHE